MICQADPASAKRNGSPATTEPKKEIGGGCGCQILAQNRSSTHLKQERSLPELRAVARRCRCDDHIRRIFEPSSTWGAGTSGGLLRAVDRGPQGSSRRQQTVAPPPDLNRSKAVSAGDQDCSDAPSVVEMTGGRGAAAARGFGDIGRFRAEPSALDDATRKIDGHRGKRSSGISAGKARTMRQNADVLRNSGRHRCAGRVVHAASSDPAPCIAS